jgi:hypothetical protein
MPPQQVASGKDCPQLYANAGSDGWTLLEDDTYARVDTLPNRLTPLPRNRAAPPHRGASAYAAPAARQR